MFVKSKGVMALLLLILGTVLLIYSYESFHHQITAVPGKNSSLIANEIPELSGSHVKIRDIVAVEEKIRLLSDGGGSKLQVITDFDRTLSKYHSNGKLTLSSYGVFASIPEIPKSYKDEAWSLYKKYGAIEEDPLMKIIDKIPFMEEWWDKYEHIVMDLPFDCDSINEAVVQNNISIRDGADIAFSRLNDAQIPVLVFSAGLGDIVSSIIKHNKLNFTNVRVISNFFSHKNGQIKGFQNKPIHVFNKNEHAIENTDYFKELSSRTNVILLGDSLGDSFMADGVSGDASVLKIGFLNSQVEESLSSYLQYFDLVLIDDQSMDILNAILNYIL